MGNLEPRSGQNSRPNCLTICTAETRGGQRGHRNALNARPSPDVLARQGKYESGWWVRQDSNLQPDGYEPSLSLSHRAACRCLCVNYSGFPL